MEEQYFQDSDGSPMDISDISNFKKKVNDKSEAVQKIRVKTVEGIISFLQCQCKEDSQTKCLKCSLSYLQYFYNKQYVNIYYVPTHKLPITATKHTLVVSYLYYYLSYHDWNSIIPVITIMLNNINRFASPVWKSYFIMAINHPRSSNVQLFDFMLLYKKLNGASRLQLYSDSVIYFMSVGDLALAKQVLDIAAANKGGLIGGYCKGFSKDLQFHLLDAYRGLLSYYDLCQKKRSVFNVKELQPTAEKATVSLMGYFEETAAVQTDFPYLKQLLDSMFIANGNKQALNFIRNKILVDSYVRDYSTLLCLIDFLTKNYPAQHNLIVICLKELLQIVPSDEHVIELCKYLCEYGDTDSLANAVEHLAEYLDYPANRDHIEAWMLLTQILPQVQKEVKKKLWEERKFWWPRFHFTVIPDLPNDDAAKLLALKAFVSYFLAKKSNSFVFSTCKALKDFFPEYYAKLINLLSEKGVQQ